ncbi:hypothetical protein DL769_007373 [Monosporascus sp. CRB-8-3]|nr:hypothetical protein DL769_007373 [Monosporascus sp. CRB-8-3]
MDYTAEQLDGQTLVESNDQAFLTLDKEFWTPEKSSPPSPIEWHTTMDAVKINLEAASLALGDYLRTLGEVQARVQRLDGEVNAHKGQKLAATLWIARSRQLSRDITTLSREVGAGAAAMESDQGMPSPEMRRQFRHDLFHASFNINERKTVFGKMDDLLSKPNPRSEEGTAQDTTAAPISMLSESDLATLLADWDLSLIASDIVADLPVGHPDSYRWNNRVPDVTQLSPITHVILAFMSWDVFVQRRPERRPLFDSISSIRAKFAPSTKVLVAIGGWGDNKGFAQAAKTDASRKQLARNVATMVRDTGADGVDMDWEYPDSISSAAVPGLPRDMIAFTEDTIPSINQSLDFVNVMTYDLMNRRDAVTKHHACVQGSLEAVETYINHGFPRRSSTVGFAFYVKWFNPAPDEALESKYYDEVGGELYYWNAADRPWWTWETTETIKKRFVRIMATKSLGGVFAWALGEDSPDFNHVTTLNEAVAA